MALQVLIFQKIVNLLQVYTQPLATMTKSQEPAKYICMRLNFKAFIKQLVVSPTVNENFYDLILKVSLVVHMYTRNGMRT
jgi:hypothetical protein